MTAKELKNKILFDEGATEFHVIGFTDGWKSWWHVHEAEEVPENWMLKPVPMQG